MTDTTRIVPIPLGNRVILVKDEAPTETAGGIHLPQDSREKPLLAHVVALSASVEACGPICVGDDVVYASFAGTEFLIEGVEVIVVDADDIMIVLREVVPPLDDVPVLRIAPDDDEVQAVEASGDEVPNDN